MIHSLPKTKLNSLEVRSTFLVWKVKVYRLTWKTKATLAEEKEVHLLRSL